VSPPLWLRYLLVLVAATIVSAALPAGGASEAALVAAVQVSVIGALAWAIRTYRPRPRTPWLVFLAAFTVYLAGSLIASGPAVGILAPLAQPSVADALYAATYLLFAIGLGLLLSERLGHRGGLDLTSLIDALVVTVAIGFFLFVYPFGPVLDAPGLSPTTRLVLAAYPVADLVLVAGVLWLAFTPGSRLPALELLLAGVASRVAGDTLSGLSSAGQASTVTLAQPLWLLTLALVGAAALHPSMARLAAPSDGPPLVSPRWRRSLLALASVAVILHLISAAHGAGTAGDILAALAALAIVGLVAFRFRGLAGDVDAYAWSQAELRGSEERYRALADELETRIAERTAELRQAKEQAEEASRAKSTFLSSVSHDLRTPLNAILGFGQLLERSDLSADDREAVTHIMRAGRSLLEMIDTVLDLSHVEAGELTLSIEPVSAEDVIREAVDLVGPMAAGRGIRLELPAGIERLPAVLADRRRLQQVVLNLLRNAVTYNREQGSVTIAGAVTDGDRFRLSVTDTGPGIPPERRHTLFAPFDRRAGGPAGSSGPRPAGLGIGLALSARLVEAMGGSIEVESELGTGSTFSIELPLAPVLPPEAGRERVAAGPAGGGAAPRTTILYVEDNLASLRLIERILAGRPETRLLAAMQGRLALDLARQHRPHLILLDLHLADVSGEEVLRLLGEDPATSRIPVIALSSAPEQGDGSRIRGLGAAGFLAKPIDVTRFQAMVERVLGGAVSGA